jgi:hypothetical protein
MIGDGFGPVKHGRGFFETDETEVATNELLVCWQNAGPPIRPH